MIDKVGDQCLERDRIAENGEYVEENDALLNGSILQNQPHARDCTENGPVWESLGIW